MEGALRGVSDATAARNLQEFGEQLSQRIVAGRDCLPDQLGNTVSIYVLFLLTCYVKTTFRTTNGLISTNRRNHTSRSTFVGVSLLFSLKR
jgi:hypothetical protein